MRSAKFQFSYSFFSRGMVYCFRKVIPLRGATLFRVACLFTFSSYGTFQISYFSLLQAAELLMLKLRFLLSPLLFPVYHVRYPFPLVSFPVLCTYFSFVLLSMFILYTVFGILSSIFTFFITKKEPYTHVHDPFHQLIIVKSNTVPFAFCSLNAII